MHLWATPRLEPAAGEVLWFGAERRFQLLAVAALHGARGVGREHAAALLWPGHARAEALRNLRKVLHRAHALVPELHSDDHRIGWPVATDLEHFEAALLHERVDDALELLPPGAEPLQGLAEASDIGLTQWLGDERQRLLARSSEALRRALRRETLELSLRLRVAERLLQQEALDEEAVAVQVMLQQRSGRPMQARRAYDLYAQRLRAELGLEPSRALQLQLGARTAATLLPQPQRPFCGRSLELRDAHALLEQAPARLVTLQGPGGVGKSSLARELLARASERRERRALWIDLQDVTDGPALLARLAERLDVPVGAAPRAAATLAHGLGREQALLVLDNAEHLRAPLAELLPPLFEAAPALQALVTSRVRLELEGERVLALRGLALPDGDSRDLEAARSFDAVRLFEARATAARRDFSLERDWRAVLDIVDAVGGLPLGIELAAAWVRSLPTGVIATQLRGSLELLRRSPWPAPRAARPEHESLQHVLEGSWARLSADEQAALRNLTVFDGGCTLEAARAVAACPLALASSLADQGLLSIDEHERLQLHPLVAAFARQSRAADGAADAALRERHAQWYAALATMLQPHATGKARLLIAGVEPELANLCAAWRYAVGERRTGLLAALCRSLWGYHELRGRQAEGVALLQPALAVLDSGPDAALARVRLAHGLSMLLHRCGRNAEARQLARAAIEDGEACGDAEAWVGCVLNTGSNYWADGRSDEAEVWFRRGVDLARRLGHPQCLAWAIGNLAVARHRLGHVEDARTLLWQALQGSREAGDEYNETVHLINLGGLERGVGRWGAAQLWLQAAQALASRTGMHVHTMHATSNLAHAMREQGDLAGARAAHEAALDLARRGGAHLVEWGARIGLARVDMAEGRFDAALGALQDVAREAMAEGCPGEARQACTAWGDWLDRRGDAAAAAPWRLALDSALLTPIERRRIESRLAAIDPESRQPVPALEEAVGQLLAQQRLTDP